MHRGLGGENTGDNGRSEESQSLHRNVVEQEHETDCQCGRGEDTLLHGPRVQFVQNNSGADLLSFESRVRQIFLFLAKPSGGLDTICHQNIGRNADDDGDDAFNQKDHLPSDDRADAVNL